MSALSICYLCGEPIQDEQSADHAVPRQLMVRKQPKAKGFDYGGTVATHAKCNNRFGPETYSAKALELIGALHDERCFTIRQHASDPSIKMMAVNAECLPNFTDRDLRFFKLIDVRDKEIAEFSDPSFFNGKTKTNPTREALFVALMVLTKSAAALLVARHLDSVPSKWKVLAIPYSGATDELDFDVIFGTTKPFDVGVKVWMRPFECGDWFVLYRTRGALVYFLFNFSESQTTWNGMIERFRDAQPLAFDGTSLNELLTTGWRRI